MRALVVDGSNLGKLDGGRLDLNLLRDAVAALEARHPGTPIVTVLDRHEAYRRDVPAALRAEVRQAFAAGESVEPPANVAGGADGFILAMAEQHGASVVSNDGFADLTAGFPWLWEAGRLLGADHGQLGWTFMLRAPSRRRDSGARRRTTRPCPPPAGTPPVAGPELTPPRRVHGSDLRGRELLEVGAVEEARACFEAAVSEKRKAIGCGGADHDDLGLSLHDVGSCHFAVGDTEAAIEYFEQAIAEKMAGNERGRIIHHSVGNTAHELGTCYWRENDFRAARSWYERAVTEKRRATVDRESLGWSLHQVGVCFASGRESEAAQTFFHQAVIERRKGDARGMINLAGLADSLDGVAAGFVARGDWANARAWHRRALDAARSADRGGLIDRLSLDAILSSAARCMRALGEQSAAQELEAELEAVRDRPYPVAPPARTGAVDWSVPDARQLDPAKIDALADTYEATLGRALSLEEGEILRHSIRGVYLHSADAGVIPSGAVLLHFLRAFLEYELAEAPKDEWDVEAVARVQGDLERALRTI